MLQDGDRYVLNKVKTVVMTSNCVKTGYLVVNGGFMPLLLILSHGTTACKKGIIVYQAGGAKLVSWQHTSCIAVCQKES